MQRKRVYHLRLSREGISSPLVKKEVRELEERGIPHGDHHGTRQRGYRALYCPQKRGNFTLTICWFIAVGLSLGLVKR